MLACLALGLNTVQAKEVDLPDFNGKSHYWVKNWNTWASDGGAYDGQCLYSPRVSAGQARITDEEGKAVYFEVNSLVNDVRKSIWWISTCDNGLNADFSTFWESVESAAISEDHQDVTWAIISHMISLKVIPDLDQASRMSPQQIQRAMRKYTQLAFDRPIQWE